MATDNKFPEIKEVTKLHLEIDDLRSIVSIKECELRETLLNGIEGILIEMDSPVELDIDGAVLFEGEYWEEEEPNPDCCKTLNDYCGIDEIFFNEDTGVAEVRIDDDDSFDIRHFNSCDLLEIYKTLKERYDKNECK